MNEMPDRQNRSLLKRITVSGYKSIAGNESFQSIDFNDITVIIGANGSGKSNLISFFKMLNNMMTGAVQNFIGKNGFAEAILHFGSKQTPLFHANLQFKNSTDSDEYDFSLEKTSQGQMIFSEEKIIWNGHIHDFGAGHKESFLATSALSHSYEKTIRHILSNCRAYQFHDTSDSSRIRNYANIGNNRFLMSDGGNIAAYLTMIKSKYRNYYQRIVDKIRIVVPQFYDFVLEPEMLNNNTIKLNWYSKKNQEYILGPDQFSDGSIRFIALATLFLQPPELLPNVIIIDEPELGLHPQAIDILSSMIESVSQDVQVIIATQSPRFLDSFSPDNVVVAEYDDENQTSIFKRLRTADFSDWLADYSLSQLWEKNVIGGQP